MPSASDPPPRRPLNLGRLATVDASPTTTARGLDMADLLADSPLDVDVGLSISGSPSLNGALSFPPSPTMLPAPASLESTPITVSSPPTSSSSQTTVRGNRSDQVVTDRASSPHTRAPGSIAEAMSATRSPGLIRRLSRGAHNKLRRRASTTHSMRMRDQSAGPILMRRRSDSNGASDFPQDVSDLELDSTIDDIDEMPDAASFKDRNNALGINVGRPSIASSSRTNTFEGGIAPAYSVVLGNGTELWKITKRHRKRIRLWLDSNSARVCWHSTKASKSFFIDDVREVRVGADSRNARDGVEIPDDQEGRWMTIVYDGAERSNGRTIKTMHVLMDEDYILKLWTDALNMVTRERIEVMNALSTSSEKAEKSLAIAWRQAMTRKGEHAEERFSLDDARWLCRKLEINCTDSTIRTHFKLVSTNEAKPLDYEQYRSFVQSFRERKDIQHIYRNIKFGTDLDMDLETFLDFLKHEQMVDTVKERAHWESVFEKFSRPAQNRPVLPDADPSPCARVLTTQSFQSFLTSSYNSPLVPLKGDPTLDKPLNEYFISSSHNTYLLGRQVAGLSSVEGYVATLIKGCRCVEIDCWDGDDGRPQVTHGRTMTTKIPFEDCVSVIAKYAFNSSPYPLIVSLEVHCCPEQQLAMVDLIKKYFHSMLVTELLVPNPTSLPSPEELRNRILIKVKFSEDCEQNQFLTDTSNGRSRARSISSAFTRTPSSESPRHVNSPVLSVPATASPSGSTGYSTPRGSTTSGPVLTPSTSADDSDEAPLSARKAAKKRRPGIIPELGKLGVYTQGIKFHGFQAPNAKAFNHVYSFNEDTFEKRSAKATDSKALLEKHNTRYLMRVYPAPLRIDSSNFNPLRSWRRGVQMAALNWQTYDVHQQINEAMFAAGSDRYGYVLKPDRLRHAKHLPIADTLAEGQRKKEKKGKVLQRFAVDIISAQRLPRPRNQNVEAGMNPYVEMELFSAEEKERFASPPEGGVDAYPRDGGPASITQSRKRTRVVEGNGFNPSYYSTMPMQTITKFPELLFVRWTVWNATDGRSNANNVLLATFTAKLSSLQQGYRHLPLFNPQGEQYRDAKLFVKIRKEAPIPIQYEDTAPGVTDQHPNSPRPESLRSERSWPLRILGRNSSRRREPSAVEAAGALSRTSSLERDAGR